jgi:hypothetical protein
MKLLRRNVLVLILVAVVLNVAGCALDRNPVPLANLSTAKLVDFPDVRAWGDEYSEMFQNDVIESMRVESKKDFPLNADGSTSYRVLALSGGGENGAFGAGILCGWTKAGTRGKFKLVTGVSTGSLIAPYAFLGADYDQKLKEAYTTISGKDIFKKKNVLSLLWGESAGDTTPLEKLIADQMDEKMLKDIAKEHAAGRRLYVGTTAMDSGRLMVWNMGAIAASGHPNALELFRKVMLASAAIPGAFPPVYFDVEVDGVQYDEMHSDGGTIANVFFYGFMLDLPAARKELYGSKAPPAGGILYIIRNGKLQAPPKQIKRKFTKIVGRAISIITKAGTDGDIYRIYAITQRDGIDFNFIDIPKDYEATSEKSFSKVEMNQLFDLGFDMAKSGKEWEKLPMGLNKIKQVQK